MVELPSYDEHKHEIENYKPELMPSIETVSGDVGKLVEYREETGEVVLEMDHKYIVGYSEEEVEEDMEDVMDEVYETAKELED